MIMILKHLRPCTFDINGETHFQIKFENSKKEVEINTNICNHDHVPL